MHRIEQLGHAVEVCVDDLSGHAEITGDPAHRERVDAVGGDDVLCGGDDVVGGEACGHTENCTTSDGGT